MSLALPCCLLALAAQEPAKPPPPAPQTPQLHFELGAAGSALVYRGVYGFGGLVELGARLFLPFGSLAFSLRVALEQHIRPEPAPLVLNLGTTLTYTLGRPRWRLSPYVGVQASAMLQRSPDSIGDIPLQRDESALVLGALAGAQLRLWRGGLFTELGYRGAVYRQALANVPAWNTVLVQLGYRFSFD